MARWAVSAGYDVVVYARLERGLPAEEERDGYRIVRVPWHLFALFPVLGLPRRAKRKAGSLLRRIARRARRILGRNPDRPAAAPPVARGVPAGPASPAGRTAGLVGTIAGVRRMVVAFPVRPLVWHRALEAVAEPADIWHGMWAGSLPASTGLARRLGGRAIYDSRDVYMESRDFSRAPGIVKAALSRAERHWVSRTDRVLTVNAPYADLLARQLRIPPPPVVMNCPERWTPPVPRPDRFREALGLGPEVQIVAYQGLLITERGVEQTIAAMEDVPGAALVLLGWGKDQPAFERIAGAQPFRDRVFFLPPVPVDELLYWTASADVSVMAIQPTTVNHRFTTPQKLFESLAAGTPVVASDLPGMATIVRDAGVGVLVEPTSPSAIAAGINEILGASWDDRQRLRAAALRAAHERYSWEAQLATLRELYESLLPASLRPGADTGADGG